MDARPWDAYVPTWTADVTQPVPRDATLQGMLSADRRHAAIRLVIGEHTELGEGAWHFSFPVANPNKRPFFVTIGRDGLAWWLALGHVVDGLLSFNIETTGQFVGPDCPFRWQAGDVLLATNHELPAEAARLTTYLRTLA